MTDPTDAGRVVGYVTRMSLDAMKVCSSDEHNGYAYIWMRPTTGDAIPLVRESLLAEAESRVAKLEIENSLKTRAVDRWVPCPDHRDKTDDQGCYVCRNEKLQRQRDALQAQVDAVRTTADQWKQGVEQMGGHDTPHTDAAVMACVNEIRAALGEEK